jgi:hypothetical protein
MGGCRNGTPLMRRNCALLLAFAALCGGWPCVLVGEDAAPMVPPAASRSIDFERDIQPLFAERCNYCHGEDDQQAQLRLDAKAIVLKGGKSGRLFEAGKSAESLLIKRLAGIGGKQMPLDDEPLTAEQIGLVRAWIDQGAAWPDGVGSPATEVKKHWAYVAPVRQTPPNVKDIAWPENAVDRFVLARLEREGVAPSAAADRERLIRRASLDLIGLPPDVAEQDAFLVDASPDAYERLVDRLLASPRYGERWATAWLDAARYADSNGYQRDGHRTAWPYRDWVIRALNGDMPFDEFTALQIAGDLLPGATIDQRIATGFHRSTTVSVEAGTDEEENRVNQVMDRVNVTGTVWLGTTLECCQCHDHKYDPFTQRDYYQFFAFFNNSPKETYQRTKGSASLEFGGPEATLPADPEMDERRQQLASQKSQLEAEIEQCLSDEATGLAAWLTEMADPEKAEAAKLPANVKRFLAIKADKRRPAQEKVLRNYFVSMHPMAKKVQAEMNEVQQRLDALKPPSSLVMEEMSEPRMTAILKRGNFLTPGDAVEAGTPGTLPNLRAGAPKNRLGLAEWLVSPENPLTARVQANRAWSQFFGRGIVVSEEDFGTQSEAPTHPELIDWLASEFQGRSTKDEGRNAEKGGGWSMKTVHRRVVESATYRQSSKFRSDLVARDPNNLLLARGPRLRLPAELVRDNALAAGGRLSAKMHGPPVYPPQPEGIWRVTGAVDNTYRTSAGDDAWRRGLYTVWRRSAPYPSFVNFDAPDRSACTVKRPRSNTPLQALTLQNDPVYVELSWSLAERVMNEAARWPLEDQLTHAFRLVLSRRPSEVERAALETAYQQAAERYKADAGARRRLIGTRTLPRKDGVAAAAWFNVAQILLNLDETITKN